MFYYLFLDLVEIGLFSTGLDGFLELVFVIILTMEIYVEYAFLENFLLDTALCYLALKLSKSKVKGAGLALGGGVGGAFAIGYPLLKAYLSWLAFVLRIGLPFLICLCAFDGRILPKEWGRYALCVLSFYLLSFAFAGGAYAVCGLFGIAYAYGDGVFVGVPIGVCFAVFVGVFVLFRWFYKGVYKRKNAIRFIYPCELKLGGKVVCADGFVDSGNVARKEGKPVCFVTADLFFELVGADFTSLATEELAVTTVSGRTKIKIFFLDEIKIYYDGKTNIITKPYCGVKPLSGTRAYKVLLGAWALDWD